MNHSPRIHTATPGLYTVQGNIKMPKHKMCFLKHFKIVVTCHFTSGSLKNQALPYKTNLLTFEIKCSCTLYTSPKTADVY